MFQIYTAHQIDKAANALLRGGVVSFPTETVYGLGADLENSSAIQKVYESKNRHSDHPVIIHIDSIEKLFLLSRNLPDYCDRLLRSFWPGPLTVIVNKSAIVPMSITGGLDTVGIRMPNHPLALQLLKTFKYGLIGPSANPYGRISPTCASHVEEHLYRDIDGVIDGGSCQVGIESTIVHLNESGVVILREGAISGEQLSEVVPVIQMRQNTLPACPGTHHTHYAPKAKMLVAKQENLDWLVQSLQAKNLKLAGFGFYEFEGLPWVKMPKNAKLYANKLYKTMHNLDKGDYDVIVCEETPHDSSWKAIRDRIARASFDGCIDFV